MDKLRIGLKNCAYGRNKGLISSYHRQRGHKKLYTFVDNNNYLSFLSGKIFKIIKDPYRTGNLAGIIYTNGVVVYQLCSEGTIVGDLIPKIDTQKFDYKQKNISCALKQVKVGSTIFNINFGGNRNRSSSFAKSAGTFCVFVKKYNKTGLIRLPSGQYRLVSLESQCTIGRVSNMSHKENCIGKAGRNRWLGKRPHVRGQAMNPVDHPHGGRTNGGIVLKTPWGRIAKGVKTRSIKNKKYIR